MDEEIKTQTEEDPAIRTVEGRRVLSVNELLGRTVLASDGSEMGTIGELYVDADAEPTLHAVVDVGGLLGVGARPVLVSLAGAVMTGSQIELPISPSELERAPEFDED